MLHSRRRQSFGQVRRRAGKRRLRNGAFRQRQNGQRASLQGSRVCARRLPATGSLSAPLESRPSLSSIFSPTALGQLSRAPQCNCDASASSAAQQADYPLSWLEISRHCSMLSASLLLLMLLPPLCSCKQAAWCKLSSEQEGAWRAPGTDG